MGMQHNPASAMKMNNVRAANLSGGGGKSLCEGTDFERLHEGTGDHSLSDLEDTRTTRGVETDIKGATTKDEESGEGGSYTGNGINVLSEVEIFDEIVR